MNLSRIFIERPVATTILVAAIVIFGAIAFRTLPVNDLPNVDFPTISVTAELPGANPEVMASTVATPLERQFSQIAGVDAMNSVNSTGRTRITLQFSLERDIDSAAQDVQTAISQAARRMPASGPYGDRARAALLADLQTQIQAAKGKVLQARPLPVRLQAAVKSQEAAAAAATTGTPAATATASTPPTAASARAASCPPPTSPQWSSATTPTAPSTGRGRWRGTASTPSGANGSRFHSSGLTWPSSTSPCTIRRAPSPSWGEHSAAGGRGRAPRGRGVAGARVERGGCSTCRRSSCGG